MGIRQAAAEKLVRQLLELRLTRLTALSDEFIATMGKMVVAFVDMDEQRQRSEEIMEETPINQCDGCRRGLPLRANNIHYEDKSFPEAMPVMACEKERYTAAPHAEEEKK